MKIDSHHIRTIALKEGFTLCGTVRCHVMTDQKVFFDRWLANGYNSTLSFMERHLDKRFNPATLLDGAQSIIVCALNYKNNALNCNHDHNSSKIASYAVMADYHNTLRAMLTSVLQALQSEFSGLHGRCFVDTAPLLEKAWAAEAGLGWIGCNSLLINPTYGSYLLLGEIVIDAQVENYDTPPDAVIGCGNCRRCIDSCPNSAIREPRVIDTGRCISQLTQYSPECDPQQLHGWVYGCDACQICCPHNTNSPEGNLHSVQPLIAPQLLTREFWQSLSAQDFKQIFGPTPVARAKLEIIKNRLEIVK